MGKNATLTQAIWNFRAAYFPALLLTTELAIWAAHMGTRGAPADWLLWKIFVVAVLVQLCLYRVLYDNDKNGVLRAAGSVIWPLLLVLLLIVCIAAQNKNFHFLFECNPRTLFFLLLFNQFGSTFCMGRKPVRK